MIFYSFLIQMQLNKKIALKQQQKYVKHEMDVKNDAASVYMRE